MTPPALTPASLSRLSVTDIRTGLLAKDFSATEIAETALASLEERDATIHSFLEHTPELARAAAAKVDAAIAAGEGDQLGPLVGVPMGFKDNMNLEGTHTTCASRILEDYVSPYTATCVERCLDAGAIPLGKCNMDEFAFGSSTETSAFGPTYNPWDTSRAPGGSSGGSAAAVAAGIATVSLGSDTGGSIRQPACFCGVVGLKPTYGAVSRYGVVAFGSSLDQVGPFGRSVSDVALTLNALAGHDPRDCTSQDITTDFTANLQEGVAGMSIGVVKEFMEAEGMTAEIREVVESAVATLESLGAQIVEVSLPNAAAAMSAYYVLGPCEAFSNLSRFDSVRYGLRVAADELGEQYEQTRAKGFGPEAVRRIMLGSYLLSSGVYDTYYYPAQQVRTLITQDYTEAFQKCQAILTPVSPRTAFKLGEVSDPTSMYLSDIFTISINIAGNGGLSLPLALGKDTGLPVNVQLICPPFKDENILRVGAALEAEYRFDSLAPAYRPDDEGGEAR